MLRGTGFIRDLPSLRAGIQPPDAHSSGPRQDHPAAYRESPGSYTGYQGTRGESRDHLALAAGQLSEVAGGLSTDATVERGGLLRAHGARSATMVLSVTGTRLTGGAPTGDVLQFARRSSPRWRSSQRRRRRLRRGAAGCRIVVPLTEPPRQHRCSARRAPPPRP